MAVLCLYDARLVHLLTTYIKKKKDIVNCNMKCPLMNYFILKSIQFSLLKIIKFNGKYLKFYLEKSSFRLT